MEEKVGRTSLPAGKMALAYKILDPDAWAPLCLEISLAWLLPTERLSISLNDDAQARSICNLNSDKNLARDMHGWRRMKRGI